MTADGKTPGCGDDKQRSRPGFRGTWDGAVALVAWGALALALFIWYGAWLLPERAVSIRILASVLSDIVWIPLGVVLWYLLLDRIAAALMPVGGVFRGLARRVTVIAIVAAVVVLARDLMFRFLFVPMLFAGLLSLLRIRPSRLRVSPFIPAIPLCLFALLAIFYYGWQLVPMRSPGAADTADLSIMSYNIYLNANAEARSKVVETIRREQPDIVSLVEVRYRRDERLFRDELGDIYPYIITNERVNYIRSSSMVLSKYPVAFKPLDIHDLGLGQIDFTFVDVTVGEQTVSLVNFHLITVGHYFERLHHDTGDIRERLAATSENEAAIDETRFAQVQGVGRLLETFEGPIILCGDLNDTPNSRVYRFFRQRYDDPFADCGWGLGASFGRNWLLRKPRFSQLPLSSLYASDVIRIDHVFIGGGIRPVSMRVLSDADGSDHRPVIATVSLN